MTRISVIVPLYNKELSIDSTLHSILNQDYSNYEVIVVDDGSTDSSANIVQTIKDDKIRFFSKENGGVSSARNYGIKQAVGEYCLFFDADDYMMPNALSTFESIIQEHPGFIMYTGNVWNCFGSKKKLRCKINKQTSVISRNPYYDVWRDRLTTSTGCYLFKKTVVDKIGYLNEKLSFFEDFDFTHRLLDLNSVVYTSTPVMSYRMEYGNLSGCNHKLEKEFAYYLTSKDINGGFWREIVFAENVRYTEYIRSLANDHQGVCYYREKYKTIFSTRCHLFFHISDMIKRIKRKIGVII